MVRTGFPIGVSEAIKWYVYRLIDPRNGETFYVGKGKGDRVFSHALGVAESDKEDALDLKLSRIREIRSAGLDVMHIIHQHAIPDESTAFRIETAIIDAFPGLTNRISGHGANEFGVRHVEEIIAEYAAEEFVPQHRLLAISIGKSFSERSVYDAVRGIWKVNVSRARRQELVLAVVGRMVRGVFVASDWVEATPEYFPQLTEAIPGRFGFIGSEAVDSVSSLYKNKTVPQAFKHGQNPIRFIPNAI